VYNVAHVVIAVLMTFDVYQGGNILPQFLCLFVCLFVCV